MIERCGNCLEYYNQGYTDGKSITERFDTILTEAEVYEMAESGGRLEGYWAITIQTPYGKFPFTTDRHWIDLLNLLTESCGVKISSLKFNLKQNVVGYQFAMREE